MGIPVALCPPPFSTPCDAHACPLSTAHGVQRRKYVTLFVKATSGPADTAAADDILDAAPEGVLTATVRDLQRPLGLLLALAAALWLGMDGSLDAGVGTQCNFLGHWGSLCSCIPKVVMPHPCIRRCM